MRKVILLVVIVLLVACSKEVSFNFSEEIITEIEKLPEEIQQEIVAPTELTSSPEHISFSYNSNPIEDSSGDIIKTEFTYGGGDAGWVLHVSTWHKTLESDDNNHETITLENGIEAKIIKNHYSKVLEWENEHGNTHTLLLIQHPEKELEYTMDDLVKVANSMQMVKR